MVDSHIWVCLCVLVFNICMMLPILIEESNEKLFLTTAYQKGYLWRSGRSPLEWSPASRGYATYPYIIEIEDNGYMRYKASIFFDEYMTVNQYLEKTLI